MSAFERLQNYNSRGSALRSDVFDVKTPEGAFLTQIHKQGFDLYKRGYKKDDEFICESEYNALDESEKVNWVEGIEYTELYYALTTKGNLLINAVAGSGKALKNGTKVYTKDGLRAIETLKVGDLVFGEDGNLYPVQGVFPQGLKKEFKVTFDNFKTITCCGDHLWTDIRGITKTTREWMADMEGKLIGMCLPECKPLYCENSTDKLISAPIDDRLDFIENSWFRHCRCMVYRFGNEAEVNEAVELLNSLGIRTKTVFPKQAKSNMVSYSDSLHVIGISELDSESEMTCISIDSPSHLYVIEGGIPTHNTTMLTFKVLYDIVTGEAMTMKQIPSGQSVPMVNKMWVCTFLKTGAEELEKSLTSWQKKLGYSQTSNQISFSTLDAEFKRSLNAMGVDTPIGDAGKLHSLLCKAIDSCNVTRQGNPLNKEDYLIISGVINYYRGRLDNKRAEHPSCSDYGLTPTMLALITKQFASLRQANGIMDFDEIMELLYQYLYITPNPAVQDFVSNRYNYIYIDEFQDTSQMQYEILRFYNRGHLAINKSGSADENTPSGLFTATQTVGKVIIVGDPSQTIYSFKGSDAKLLTDNALSDYKPTIRALSTNWRCPSNILNPVVSSIHKNPSSANQKIVSAKDGGVFNAYAFGSIKKMLDKLAEEIDTDMFNENSVAILVRTNFDGAIPALFLESCKRFNFSISGDNMTLTSPLPRKLIGVSALFTERSTPAVKNALSLFVGFRNQYEVAQVMDICKMNNMNIWQIPEDDLKYSAPSLYSLIKSMKPTFITNGVRDKKLEVDTLRMLYFWLLSNIFNGDSAYAINARAYIETLVYILDSKEFNSVYDFLEEIESLSDSLSRRIKKQNTPIRIATVHEFKGKEADSVYIWNDSDQVFPSSKCDVFNDEQLEEERRVHYIACTRARKKESIYTLNNAEGMFLREMDCEIQRENVGVSLGKKAQSLCL